MYGVKSGGHVRHPTPPPESVGRVRRNPCGRKLGSPLSECGREIIHSRNLHLRVSLSKHSLCGFGSQRAPLAAIWLAGRERRLWWKQLIEPCRYQDIVSLVPAVRVGRLYEISWTSPCQGSVVFYQQGKPDNRCLTNPTQPDECTSHSLLQEKEPALDTARSGR